MGDIACGIAKGTLVADNGGGIVNLRQRIRIRRPSPVREGGGLYSPYRVATLPAHGAPRFC
jgi:hypothetical protein